MAPARHHSRETHQWLVVDESRHRHDGRIVGRGSVDCTTGRQVGRGVVRELHDGQVIGDEGGDLGPVGDGRGVACLGGR
jgi:hypothetical protein